MGEEVETKQDPSLADTVVSAQAQAATSEVIYLEQKTTTDLVGLTLSDRYEVIEVLGKGGMGVVYKGRRTQINKFVAIKVLKASLIEDEVSLKRFEQEAIASANLDDPHLISVYDFGYGPNGEPYLVMDFLEGKSLEDIIERQGPISLDRFLHIFSQACQALSYIHSRSIIHRDLKPSNIMLVKTQSSDEFVKLVDFGIAKVIGDDQRLMQKLTATGQSFGSPLYMSPEQCMGKEVDVRSDIYSLGCVMFEALTGRTPIAGENALQTVFMHINSPPLMLNQVGPGLTHPLQVQEVIMRCLEKDPDKRFQSATEIGNLLTEMSQGEYGSLVLNKVPVKESSVLAPEATLNMWMSEANQTTPLNISENIVVPEFTGNLSTSTSSASPVTMTIAKPVRPKWKSPISLVAMVIMCALGFYLFLPPFSAFQTMTTSWNKSNFESRRKEVQTLYGSSSSPEALHAYQEMEKLARDVNAPNDVSSPIAIKLGELIYRNNGDQDEAIEKMLSGIAGIEAAATPEKPAYKYPEYVQAALVLSEIYQNRKQNTEANTMLKKAYDALCANSSCDQTLKANTVLALAENQFKIGENEKAVALMDEHLGWMKDLKDKSIHNRLVRVERAMNVDKKMSRTTALDVFKMLTTGKLPRRKKAEHTDLQ
ncbi:MAG: serine/threonine-protein kinase [Candidatus Melainabacteria bacterium]|nr:serine/threonine-protein kinase [Candidatus Melainabacteria bacterium]